MSDSDNMEYFHFAVYLLECAISRQNASGFVGKLHYRVCKEVFSDSFLIETTLREWNSNDTWKFPVESMYKNLTFEKFTEMLRSHICLNH